MKRIGAHVSSSGGVENAPRNAHAIGATAFAMFTKNQKRWDAPPLAPASIAAFQAACAEFGYRPEHILPHDSYLINPCHPDPEQLEKSRAAFSEEMRRCAELGLIKLNFHPGSTLEALDTAEACRRCAETVDRAHEVAPGVIAVIENTAGQGSNLGHRLEHLAEILGRVKDRTRVGVCLDTCHAFAAGYDLRTEESCDAFFAEFDRLIGFRYLQGMHLNEAKSAWRSRVDRHESLHAGQLGDAVFRYLMRDSRFDEIPLILETIDDTRWTEEIAWLKELAAGK